MDCLEGLEKGPFFWGFVEKHPTKKAKTMEIKELFAPLVWRLLVNIHSVRPAEDLSSLCPFVREESLLRCSAGIPIELGKRIFFH